MKVGMLTYHYVNNYGAILQALGLSETVRRLGHDPVFINYQPPGEYLCSKVKKTTRNRINIFLSKLIYDVFFRKYKKDVAAMPEVFLKFRNRVFSQTRRYASFQELKLDVPEFDAYLVGSDQVWLDEPYDPVYFLDFLEPGKGRRVAYAASSNTAYINPEKIGLLRRYLNNFDAISTREERFTESINKISDIKSRTLIDPVFLPSADYWNRHMDAVPMIDGDYILVYATRPRREFTKMVNAYAKKLNLPVVAIGCNGSLVPFFGMNYSRIVADAGPREFLNLIRHAKLVCSASFHGIAFSIRFHRPFVAYTVMRDDMRINSLLNDMELSQFVTTMADEAPESVRESDFDFFRADEVIESRRKDSEAFLSETLKL